MIERNSLRGIEREDFVEKVFELANFSHLLFGEILICDQLLLEISDWLNDTHDNDFIL